MSMNWNKLGQLVLILSVMLMADCAFATTYYIAANGSDSNNGTAKVNPWLHAPGMPNCGGNCASYTPAAGDSIIFRGGDTWHFGTNTNPYTGGRWNWNWSGVAGNPIYIGVDKTWFSGASWNRPVWNADATPIAGSSNAYMQMGGNYVTLDNFEMKGFNWNSNTQGYGINTAGHDHISILNFYVHGWTHSAPATQSAFDIFYGDTNAPHGVGSLIDHAVIDGSDSTNGGDSAAFNYAWPSVTNSVIHNIPDGPLMAGHGEIGNNLIYDIVTDFGGGHPNAMEILGSDGTFYIHDNVVHDSYGEALFAGYGTIYVWNNVWYNLHENPPAIDSRAGSSSTSFNYFYNNVIVPNSGDSCLHGGGNSPYNVATVQVVNNHCITTNSAFGNPANGTDWRITYTTNLIQPPATAASQGYTSSQTFAYSPTSAGNSTVGTGTNETGSWPPGFNTNDTTYACTQQMISGVVQSVCPARTSTSRPSSGSWGRGAYQFGGASSSASPQPPTGLFATTQ